MRLVVVTLVLVLSGGLAAEQVPPADPAKVEAGGLHSPTPIGFYFAKLWYFEKLYPIIFSVAALGRARNCFDAPP